MNQYLGASLQELSSNQPIGYGVPAEKIAEELIERLGIEASQKVMQALEVELTKRIGSNLKPEFYADSEDEERTAKEQFVD